MIRFRFVNCKAHKCVQQTGVARLGCKRFRILEEDVLQQTVFTREAIILWRIINRTTAQLSCRLINTIILKTKLPESNVPRSSHGANINYRNLISSQRGTRPLSLNKLRLPIMSQKWNHHMFPSAPDNRAISSYHSRSPRYRVLPRKRPSARIVPARSECFRMPMEWLTRQKRSADD